MHWWVLSPHLDDGVYSCGGWLWEQRRQGATATIVTVCAGDPPPGDFSPLAQLLHARWGLGADAVAVRRQEDRAAAALLGVDTVHLPLPDCIYRRHPTDGTPLYVLLEDVFDTLHPAEAQLVAGVRDRLAALLPPDGALLCPLALGGHVDHRLTRAAAEALGRPLRYYADYPYAAQPEAEATLDALQAQGWQTERHAVSEAGLQAWIAAADAYRSQRSTFWEDRDAMAAAFRAFRDRWQGVTFWLTPAG